MSPAAAQVGGVGKGVRGHGGTVEQVCDALPQGLVHRPSVTAGVSTATLGNPLAAVTPASSHTELLLPWREGPVCRILKEAQFLKTNAQWQLTRSKALVALCIFLYMRTILRVGKPSW